MLDWVEVIGLIFVAVFCLGTLGFGLWLLIDSVKFSCVAVRAVGKVVRIHAQEEEINRSNDAGTWTEHVMVHYPVFAFEDEEGVKHEVRANLGNICTPGYQVGEQVPVRFIQGDLRSMRIDSFVSLYGSAFCLLFIAAIGTMFLAFFLYYA